MKEKFVQLGKDLPFRSKVTILCIVVSMIPMLLLGSLAYRHIREQLVQQETINLEDTLRRESEAIEADLDYYLNALDMIVWNDGIKSGVNRIYDTNYDLFMFYKETLDPTIHTLRTLSPDIRTVTLYTDANINSHGDKVLPLNMAERLPWYDQAMQSTVPVVRISDDGSMLYLACKMYFSYSAPTTIVSMTVDVGQMFDNAPSLFENDFGLYVADSYGDAIYETFRGQENAAFSQIPLADLQTGGFSSSTVMKQRTLHNGQWIAYLYRPLEDVRLSVRQFTGIAVIVFLACGVFSLLAARLLSKVMMRPLEQLSFHSRAGNMCDFEVEKAGGLNGGSIKLRILLRSRHISGKLKTVNNV